MTEMDDPRVPPTSSSAPFGPEPTTARIDPRSRGSQGGHPSRSSGRSTAHPLAAAPGGQWSRGEPLAHQKALADPDLRR
jgi:hypothetical protein